MYSKKNTGMIERSKKMPKLCVTVMDPSDEASRVEIWPSDLRQRMRCELRCAHCESKLV